MTNQELIIKLTEDISWLEQGCETEREIVDHIKMAIEALSELQIIYCKNCSKRNKERGYYYNGEVIHKDDACPLIEFRGRAIGCEYDYGFCNFAERKTE